jgi:hypothetical protein
MPKRKGAVRTAEFPPSMPIGSALTPLPSTLGCVLSSILGNDLASVIYAVVCVNAPRRNQRLPLPLHLAAVEDMERCLKDLIIRMIYLMTCRKGLSIHPPLLLLL